MAASTRYRDLVAAVRKLRRALLPGKFDPTGTYRSPERVHLRAVSFRLLVHAEIEHYIEDRALALFNEGWTNWTKMAAVSDVVLGLLSFSEVVTSRPPGKLGGDPENQKAYEDIGTPLSKAQAAWRHAHKQNNGIKEPNVLALLLPLGIRAADLETTLLADLSSYGTDRGAVAHSSATSLKTYADPNVEFKKALALVGDLKQLDELLSDSTARVSRLAKVK